MFLDAYAVVDSTTKAAIEKLLRTWPSYHTQLFPREIVDRIERGIQSMRQPHGMNGQPPVNPRPDPRDPRNANNMVCNFSRLEKRFIRYLCMLLYEFYSAKQTSVTGMLTGVWRLEIQRNPIHKMEAVAIKLGHIISSGRFSSSPCDPVQSPFLVTWICMATIFVLVLHARIATFRLDIENSLDLFSILFVVFVLNVLLTNPLQLSCVNDILTKSLPSFLFFSQ